LHHRRHPLRRGCARPHRGRTRRARGLLLRLGRWPAMFVVLTSLWPSSTVTGRTASDSRKEAGFARAKQQTKGIKNTLVRDSAYPGDRWDKGERRRDESP